MRRVNLIRRLSGFVLRVQQPSVLWVAQQEVGDALTATSHRHVQWVVTALAGTDEQTHRRMVVTSAIFSTNTFLQCATCLQCFDAVGWVAGRPSGL